MMAEHRAGRVTGNRRSILTHMMEAQEAGAARGRLGAGRLGARDLGQAAGAPVGGGLPPPPLDQCLSS
jgi:hypothetical protein